MRFSTQQLRAPVWRRTYATEGPNTTGQPKTKVGEFYKQFGSPILKCLLGALFTYQVVYWSWMKLETVEEKHNTEAEIADLKEELKALVVKKMEAERQAAEAKVEVKKEEKSAKKGWW